MLIHSVYFSVKSDALDSVDAMIELAKRELATIPNVSNLWAGRPVPSDRPVVDRDYTFGLSMSVADRAALAVHATHPTHVAFIERFKPMWERVRVFDFE